MLVFYLLFIIDCKKKKLLTGEVIYIYTFQKTREVIYKYSQKNNQIVVYLGIIHPSVSSRNLPS